MNSPCASSRSPALCSARAGGTPDAPPAPASLGMRTELWELLRQKDPALYRRCRHKITNAATNIPGYHGRKLSVKLYRVAQKIYKFN